MYVYIPYIYIRCIYLCQKHCDLMCRVHKKIIHFSLFTIRFFIQISYASWNFL